MKDTNNTELITVGQLVKELKRYQKKHWDWNVEITAEGVEGEEEDPTCMIIGMGKVRISITDKKPMAKFFTISFLFLGLFSPFS